MITTQMSGFLVDFLVTATDEIECKGGPFGPNFELFYFFVALRLNT